MNVRTKRRFSAWLLLLVFVPMLLSSLHVHPTVGVEDSCTECVNHVPHSGHVSLLTAHSCDCLLCQFVALVHPTGRLFGFLSVSLLADGHHPRSSHCLISTSWACCCKPSTFLLIN